MSVLDVVLGCLVVGLAGWALVHAGSPSAGRRGCGGGCGPGACGPGEADADDEELVTLSKPER